MILNNRIHNLMIKMNLRFNNQFKKVMFNQIKTKKSQTILKIPNQNIQYRIYTRSISIYKIEKIGTNFSNFNVDIYNFNLNLLCTVRYIRVHEYRYCSVLYLLYDTWYLVVYTYRYVVQNTDTEW